MNIKLDKKVALITGASKGIGEDTAQLLAKAGAEVIVVSRKLEAVEAVAESITKNGGKAHAKACNVGNMEEVAELVSWIESKFGVLHILVNNAAANPVYGPVLDCDIDAFDKIMQVNVKGPMQLARLLHPLMKKEGGSVVNISSIGGVKPEQNLGYYSISKAAMNMMTQVLAKEWGADNIRVNVICPGLIKTKFSKALWSDEKTLQRFTKHLPLQRMGNPEEIGAMILFLVSDASAYSTGSVFFADGGFTI